MLYLLKSYRRFGEEIFKLGFTDDLDKRFYQYKTSNPAIELVATRSGNIDLENRLHLYIHSLDNFKFIMDEWYIGDQNRLQYIFHINEDKLDSLIWKNRDKIFVEGSKQTLFSLYQRLCDKFNYVVNKFNKNLNKADKLYMSYHSQKHFTNLINDLITNDSQEVAIESDRSLQLVNQVNSIVTFSDKFKCLYDNKENLSNNEMLFVLNNVHNDKFKYYVEVLGWDRIKALSFENYKLKLEITKTLDQSYLNNLKSAFLSTFEVGISYTTEDIKDKLVVLYKSLGIKKLGRASDLNKYFELKTCKVKINNKWSNGFKILNIKA